MTYPAAVFPAKNLNKNKTRQITILMSENRFDANVL